MKDDEYNRKDKNEISSSNENDDSQEIVPINMEWLPSETADDYELIEIKDEKMIGMLSGLIPGLTHVVSNKLAADAARALSGGDIYRAIIPKGAKLVNSRAMEGAQRGFYRGANGIEGHANLVKMDLTGSGLNAANIASSAMSIGSLIVGQYYMNEISSQLSDISDGISQIQDFLDSTYKNQVIALVLDIQQIANFQNEILQDHDHRITKISHLNDLESKCVELLGIANDKLNEIAGKKKLSFSEYEKNIAEADKWLMYQRTLREMLYRIAELRYTLHFGEVNREYCLVKIKALDPQVNKTLEAVRKWHLEYGKALNIDTLKRRRKKDTQLDMAMAGIFNFVQHNEWNYCEMKPDTCRMIEQQKKGRQQIRALDSSALYDEDVELVARNGKLYYHPGAPRRIEHRHESFTYSAAERAVNPSPYDFQTEFAYPDNSLLYNGSENTEDLYNSMNSARDEQKNEYSSSCGSSEHSDLNGNTPPDGNDDNDIFGLTLEQTEILYNLQRFKMLDDAHNTEHHRRLKLEWMREWMNFMAAGFEGFTQTPGAVLHWYTEEELKRRIDENNPQKIWFRLVLMETMLFKPYYPLKMVKDKNGKDVPDPKYKDVEKSYGKNEEIIGDTFLEGFFTSQNCPVGYVGRLRNCYNSVHGELTRSPNNWMRNVLITAGVTLAAVFVAGAFAPAIAVALVGSNFAGLSGAALTSACLAYLGGGAIAIGGAGMAGGTIAIVGGGAILGLGVGSGLSGAARAFDSAAITGKAETIAQLDRLLITVREMILNDNHDIKTAKRILEQLEQQIIDIEKGIVEKKVKAEGASTSERKKRFEAEIKTAQEGVEVRKKARQMLARYISSFEEAIGFEDLESESDDWIL